MELWIHYRSGEDMYRHLRIFLDSVGAYKSVCPPSNSSLLIPKRRLKSQHISTIHSERRNIKVKKFHHSPNPQNGPLAKGISSIIGLSTEAAANHKQKKAAAAAAQASQGTPDVEVEQFLHSKQPPPLVENNVQAYVPAMKDCGIDEKTFMEFLDGFEKSIKASPYFHVFNLAVAVSVMAETIAVTPSIIVHATAFAVHTSVEAGRRLYMTSQ
jgi:hypothetical protein